MREIKFRAWDPVSEQLMPLSEVAVPIEDIPQPDHFHPWAPIQSYIDQGLILMQYTGFKDKNGIEIYEGDIIRYIPKNGRTKRTRKPFNDMVVVWNKHKRGGWRCLWRWNGENQLQTLADCVDENHEVLGNIYENKDLLT